MPLYSFRCPCCHYSVEDVLCSYAEAKNKDCPDCKHRLELAPPVISLVQWSGDTDFSHSYKARKE